MSDLGLWFISALTSILIVQLLNLSDLGTEISNFVAKDCEMIHTIEDNIWARLSVGGAIPSSARVTFSPMVCQPTVICGLASEQCSVAVPASHPEIEVCRTASAYCVAN